MDHTAQLYMTFLRRKISFHFLLNEALVKYSYDNSPLNERCNWYFINDFIRKEANGGKIDKKLEESSTKDCLLKPLS